MSTQAERFSRCVKTVKKNFKPKKLKRPTSNKEGTAIAICTKSILWPQKRTLKRFYRKNGKAVLYTQPRKPEA